MPQLPTEVMGLPPVENIVDLVMAMLDKRLEMSSRYRHYVDVEVIDGRYIYIVSRFIKSKARDSLPGIITLLVADTIGRMARLMIQLFYGAPHVITRYRTTHYIGLIDAEDSSICTLCLHAVANIPLAGAARMLVCTGEPRCVDVVASREKPDIIVMPTMHLLEQVETCVEKAVLPGTVTINGERRRLDRNYCITRYYAERRVQA